jgi:hypothetical protein
MMMSAKQLMEVDGLIKQIKSELKQKCLYTLYEV